MLFWCEDLLCSSCFFWVNFFDSYVAVHSITLQYYSNSEGFFFFDKMTANLFYSLWVYVRSIVMWSMEREVLHSGNNFVDDNICCLLSCYWSSHALGSILIIWIDDVYYCKVITKDIKYLPLFKLIWKSLVKY